MRSSASAVPCASVFKPVFAFLAAGREREWATLAHDAIVTSDNAAADALVDMAGGVNAVAEKLSDLGGVRVNTAQTWGKYLIGERHLAGVYAGMLRAGGPHLGTVLDLMTRVVPEQRFGVPQGVPMKAGWDMYRNDDAEPVLVTHVVRIDGTNVTARGGGRVITDNIAREWTRALYNGGSPAVVPFHQQ